MNRTSPDAPKTNLDTLLAGTPAGERGATAHVMAQWNSMLAYAAFARKAAHARLMRMPSPRAFARSMGFANYGAFKRHNDEKQKAAQALALQ